MSSASASIAAALPGGSLPEVPEEVEAGNGTSSAAAAQADAEPHTTFGDSFQEDTPLPFDAQPHLSRMLSEPAYLELHGLLQLTAANHTTAVPAARASSPKPSPPPTAAAARPARRQHAQQALQPPAAARGPSNIAAAPHIPRPD